MVTGGDYFHKTIESRIDLEFSDMHLRILKAMGTGFDYCLDRCKVGNGFCGRSGQKGTREDKYEA